MATNEDTIHVEPLALSETQLDEPPAKQRPIPGGVRFDWMTTVVLGLLIGGTYLDGWAHNHGKVDNSFFTPWHAILYAGLVLVGLFLGMNLLLNRRKGYPWREALPPGYGISLFGVVVFGIGGVLYMAWHILFGIEVSVEALLSPTHHILGLGVVLMLTGPHGNGQIYLMHSDGTHQQALTSDNGGNWAPVWSPDGSKIAFISFRDKTGQVYDWSLAQLPVTATVWDRTRGSRK